MDLGIEGRKALVCASSKGLGKACAKALAREGAQVWICARHEEALVQAAAELNVATGGRVEAVVADVTTESGREKLLEACPAPDILVNNAGGPPPGDFRDWSQGDWLEAVNANMYSAIDMIRRCLDGMIERRFGRIVNITSVAVKMPVGNLGLSNGARAGLTGFVAGIAREPARHNVTINNLLPERFDTGRQQQIAQLQTRSENLSAERDQLQQQLATASNALAEKQQDIERLESLRLALRKERDRLAAQLETANGNLSASQQQIALLQTRSETLSGERARLRDELEAASNALEQTRQQLGQLETQQQTLVGERDRLSSELKGARAARTDQQTQLQALSDQSTRLQTELDDANQALAFSDAARSTAPRVTPTIFFIATSTIECIG